MAEFTKGEWQVTGNSIYAVPVGQEPEIVCWLQGRNREANARLIASAPALYEACEGLLWLVKDYNKSLKNISLCASIKQAEEALAKAGGGDYPFKRRGGRQ